jgi:hypothetical protein
MWRNQNTSTNNGTGTRTNVGIPVQYMVLVWTQEPLCTVIPVQAVSTTGDLLQNQNTLTSNGCRYSYRYKCGHTGTVHGTGMDTRTSLYSHTSTGCLTTGALLQVSTVPTLFAVLSTSSTWTLQPDHWHGTKYKASGVPGIR